MTLVVIVNGRVRDRFVIRSGRMIVVGRSPEDPEGIAIGSHLTGEAAALVSRNHVRLELRDDMLLVSDVSTNGTVIRSRTSPFAPADEVLLNGGPAYPLKPWDSVILHDGVVLSRADSHDVRQASVTGSVMDEAPTISITPPRY